MKKNRDQGRESNSKRKARLKSEKQLPDRSEVIIPNFFSSEIAKWFTSYSGITKW